MKNYFAFVIAICLVICFAITVHAQAPAIQWQKALGGSDNDFGFCSQQTSDGGFIIGGQTNSNDGNVHGFHGDEDMWIVKLGKNGNVQWQKPLGGIEDESAFGIQQTADGGYVAAGQSLSFNIGGNHGNLDFYVVKLTANGSLQWQKSYGGSNIDFATSIQQTTDGGYIVAGGTTSTNKQVSGNHGGTDAWIIKLDSAGNIQWKKAHGGSGYDIIYSIKQTSDGGYIAAGNTTSNDGEVSGVHDQVYGDVWIIKLNKNGNLQWQKTYGGSDYDLAQSVQLTTDGGYIAAGYNRSNNGDVTNNHGNYDVWVLKLNSNGNLQWQKSLGGTGGDLGYSVAVTNDSGYVVGGGSISNNGNVSGNHGLEDFWIVKLDKSGSLIWQKSLGGSDYDEGRSVLQTKDGGYAITGFTKSNNGDVSGNHNPSYNDVWIARLSADAKTITTENIQVPLKQAFNFNVSPNPANSFIRVDISSLQSNAVLHIIDKSGNIFIEKQLLAGNFIMQVNVSKLHTGLYYAYIKDGNQVINKAFIKQ